ncbi:MAG TPA: DUF2127 domain-containing protein [Candidatus Limnocylindrales bacterium]|nr:DUF2127 domain-containing protein [Candidatus Limnocylindrales bacterium]
MKFWDQLKEELGRETQPVDTVVRLIIIERVVRSAVLYILGFALLTNSRSILRAVREFVSDLNLNGGRGLFRSLLLAILRPIGLLPSRTVVLIALGTLAFATLETIEAIGLARRRRWAEYLVVVAGTIGIPLEVHEVLLRQTPLRIGFLVINVAIVIYLAWQKHLFGLRGGRATETEKS